MLKIAYSPIFNHPFPIGHRFPMLKYDLIPEQLLYEGIITKSNLFEPEPVDEQWITLTHTKQYWDNLKNGTLQRIEERRIGFIYSKELVFREMVIVNGTIQSASYALQNGYSFNIAGGTHHAYEGKGEGFCLLNDNAIAANYLLHKKLASKVLVIDLDVHQGNGTASIFQNQNNVFTFSMHCRGNIYSAKEKSDLDIELQENVSDEVYLSVLEENLHNIIIQFNPDFVFFQAGVDVLETDKLGKLSLSKIGCRERDRVVFQKCKDFKIPVSVNMGGGYSERISDIVEAHCNTFKEAISIFG